ncbi:methyltransferase domain-containing protein [Kitasatospora sp. NPDC051853]|uniref:methyltransferase domain-containing protein n=1 Tax=Kitasatospora sp. NPDC051853 TaxID=3364058 RepID=UPI0037907AD9
MTVSFEQVRSGAVRPERVVVGSGVLGRPDPRVARVVAEALGGALTVLNVITGPGARCGAVAAGPRTAPAAPRAAVGPMPAVDAVVGELPFVDGAFDAAMAILNVHRWTDLAVGLREMRRVTRGPAVILTHDPLLVREFWLHAYAPEVLDAEAVRYPPVADLVSLLGGRVSVRPVPVPLDCTDDFNEAYYGRPERLLDPAARQAGSAWDLVGDAVRDRFDRALRHDLASSAWDARLGHLRRQASHEGALVLVRATP